MTSIASRIPGAQGRTSRRPGAAHSSPRYVVFMGDVGTGKSTILEKVTGVTERSSAASESSTFRSEYRHSLDGRLIVCDTPGSNALANTFVHNVWIAEAMNLQPVSKILVTVKADTRIDNVVKDVSEYAERFLEMDQDLLGVMVTHMDQVTWTKESCMNRIFDHLGINDVLFSRKEELGQIITDNILRVCKKDHDVNVNHENFLKLFKINNKNKKIVQSTKRQVDDFKALYHQFYEERKEFETNLKDMTDLVFEFQAWMTKRILQAQLQVSADNAFDFMGESANNETGHIANMTNQLTAILTELRIEALGYQAGHGVNVLRRCPHCNLVWGKFEGCDDETTCGSRPHAVDVRSYSHQNFNILGTFTFIWDKTRLVITKSGNRRIGERGIHRKDIDGTIINEQGHPIGLHGLGSQRTKGVIGCGEYITWSDMPMVDVPPEFTETKPVSVDDVKLMPQAAEATWQANYTDITEQIKRLINIQEPRN